MNTKKVLHVSWGDDDSLQPSDLAEIMASPLVTDVKSKSMKIDIKKAAVAPKGFLRMLGMFRAMCDVTVKLVDVPPTKIKTVIDILNKADWAKGHTLKVHPKGKKHADVSFNIVVLSAKHQSKPANTLRMRNLLEALS